VGEIQLFAMIKNGLKFFQVKELMRIIIIAEEELTHKVFTELKNNFAISGLGIRSTCSSIRASMRLRLSLQVPTLTEWRWLPR
jgi:hypothetical protein